MLLKERPKFETGLSSLINQPVCMQHDELIPNLFKTEFSKITAVLCKLFGVQHIEAAEDIASETFLSALEVWSYKGIPANPVAWLYTVARNKAFNYLHRNKIFTDKITPALQAASEKELETIVDLSEQNSTDSQLQMLFAICHPSIPAEAQIGLALRILCGFGIEEIANAFLVNKDTINKRLYRAREQLRASKLPVEFPPPAALASRLENVLTTLYLLFNEGYYSESRETVLREELCEEGMRLTELLITNERTDQPVVHALFALMCFHASRFPARKNGNGELVLYHEQDETLWDQAMIAKGAYHMNQASQGILSRYHLEAGIAYWHTIKTDSKEKWENILQLYNQLLQIHYSPIAALNRTYALAKANGKEQAIREAEKLNLVNNHYYYTLLGELYEGVDREKSIGNFLKALSLAKTKADKQAITRRLQ